jgi:chromate transporter
MRQNQKVKGALLAVNAAVVGILISAFYTPIWTSLILSARDFTFASILFSMLMFWKLPPWVVVITGAVGGYLITLF